MTFLVKCDTCGKVQEAGKSETRYPVNPINPETGEKWYSRVNGDKEEHTCSEACIPKGSMVWPKWAYP